MRSQSAATPDTAFYAVIPVKFQTTVVYAVAGMLTGLSGMIEVSRLMTGQSTGGRGYELTAIAAVVIGGVIILAVAFDEMRKRRMVKEG
jgi:ribose/xylose/arabinose/galactoside ABC-type transport system permease subunit